MKINIEFESGDFNSMHDVFLDLTGHSFTDSELETLFNVLPQHIKGIAYSWGMSDSVFRDEVYVHFENEIKKKRLQRWVVER